MGTSMFRHAALAATGVAAIFAATAAHGQDPVKIGFITELTGPWSFTGASCVAGLKLAEAQLNPPGKRRISI